MGSSDLRQRLSTLRLRVLTLFRRRQMERDLDDELAFHLRMRAANGDTDAARRRFGNPTLLRETCRDLWTFASLEAFWADLRYAARLLRKSPAFTAVAVLSLALGIGANTAIFSLVHAVLLKALPVRSPEELVLLSNPDASGVANGTQTGERALFTYEEFEQLRDRNQAFTGLLAAQSDPNRLNASIAGGPVEEVRAKLVSGDYFRVLGVGALLGRTFTAADDKGPGSDPFAVISYPFWERRFGRDASVLGKPVQIAGTHLTIIGVAPPGFFGEVVGSSPDLFVPMMMQPLLMPGRFWLRDDYSRADRVMWLHIIGRLKPGFTTARAQANIDVVFRQMLEAQAGPQITAARKHDLFDQKIKATAGARGASELREGFSEPLLVLMAVVAMVLLIACANIANLLLARAAARQKEIGVRMAIGAGRGRLIRQVLTESVLLGAIGGAAGIFVAAWGTRLMLRIVAADGEAVPLDASPDLAVLAFTAGLSILTGLLFGLAPALRVSGFGVGGALKENARGLTAGGGRVGAGRLLAAGQVAVSLVLLIGSGLFLRTLANLRTVDLGYRRDRLVIVRVDAPGAGYKGPQINNVYRELLERFRALPGVRAATMSENGLFGGTDSADQISVDGYKPHKPGDDSARWDQVGPNYFSVIGIPMLLGREIGPGDTEASRKVCVINEAMARFYFGRGNPLGRHVTDEFPDTRETFEIVGVAKDAKDHRVRGEVPRRFYIPIMQPIGGPPPNANFELRTFADPGSLIETTRRTVLDYDRNLRILSARTLDQLVDGSLRNDRLIAQLSAFFGAVALLLASIGLYGVLSYSVARRTNEIGLRMALGAEPGGVVGMIVRETGLLVVVGAACGVPLAYAATRVIASRLFGLTAADPLTMTVATALLLAVAMLAGYLPARRAAKVDPVIALRSE